MQANPTLKSTIHTSRPSGPVLLAQASNKPLLITTGEPAGIGMDIVLRLAAEGQLACLAQPVWVLADAKALQARAQHLQQQHAWSALPRWQVIDPMANHVALTKEAAFGLIDVACAQPVQPGQINTANAAMVLSQLQLAHELASSKRVAAIVTGPLQKSALIDAKLTLPDGQMFSGHTEYFMQQSGCAKVVMMLANTVMRVALVTTHLPITAVPAAITQDNVAQTVRIVLADLTGKLGITKPRVLVCGLNPHAGEGGHLGREEIEVINPVLTRFIEQGHDVSSAMPADTLFTPRHLEQADAVIAMYHDQGLPVLKSHGFGDTVNVTLGLPYIRTSVDHGTALDLAGSNQASASSLWCALQMAAQMSSQQQT